MFNHARAVSLTVSLMLVASFAAAELSSKAKRAEKMAAAGQLTEAMAIYQELMGKNAQKEPQLVKEGREGMANCLLLQAKTAFDEKNFADSKTLALQILTTYKDTPSVNESAKTLALSQLELSKQLVDGKKYDEGIAQCKEVKEKIPAGGDALKADLDKFLSQLAGDLLKLAEGHIKSGKYEEAQKNLEWASAAATDKAASAKCQYTQGVCFRLAGQNDKALAAYQDVTTDYPDSPFAATAHADLYLIHTQLDNLPEALKSIQQAASLAPENSDYLFKTAQAYQALGKTEDAKKAAKKAIDLLQAELPKTYTNKENLQYKIGQAQLILGNYTEAAVEFDKALARNADMVEAKKGLALALFNDKNYTGAVDAYDALIKKFSGDFDALNEKASKDKIPADLAKKVEDLRKDIAYFHYQKGLSYEQLGEYDNALAECRLGLEGVSTQEAAATIKRIQTAAAQKKSETAPAPAATTAPVEK
ncbi:MAG TPA: tetratricopeptide repeat protein [Elusimicrobiota bacterium]|nr:tetratricopeptide repeat protein [Elusimicrobiota bacterium]